MPKLALSSLGLALLLTALAPSTLAAEPHRADAASVSDANRSTARELGYQGVAALERGDAAEASDKLERAFALLQVPTLGYWSARALVAKGKWVEAAERYRLVARLRPTEGDVEGQRKAQADAERERESLEARLPRLEVSIAAGQPADCTASVNDEPLPPAALGVDRPMNPGKIRLQLRCAAGDDEQQLELTEGQRLSKSLQLKAAMVPEPNDAAVPTSAPDTRMQTQSGHSPWFWVSLSVGGAGLLTGAVAGSMSSYQHSHLQTACSGLQCEPEHYAELDRFQTTRLVSTLGFGVGLVGLGTAGWLLWHEPPRRDTTAQSRSQVPQLSLYTNLTSFGVQGIFR